MLALTSLCDKVIKSGAVVKQEGLSSKHVSFSEPS